MLQNPHSKILEAVLLVVACPLAVFIGNERGLYQVVSGYLCVEEHLEHLSLGVFYLDVGGSFIVFGSEEGDCFYCLASYVRI